MDIEFDIQALVASGKSSCHPHQLRTSAAAQKEVQYRSGTRTEPHDDTRKFPGEAGFFLRQPQDVFPAQKWVQATAKSKRFGSPLRRADVRPKHRSLPVMFASQSLDPTLNGPGAAFAASLARAKCREVAVGFGKPKMHGCLYNSSLARPRGLAAE